MPRTKKTTGPKLIVSTKFNDKRVGIPTAEESSYAERLALLPVTLNYPRNPDLDPQLVWKGKDRQDEHPLEVKAYPIYIQEKIHPQTLVQDLIEETKKAKDAEAIDLFGDFNGVPEGVDKTDFYHYEKNWTNRMILGDSLEVMASLAEKEGLRGKVQCIYMDPPYGIKFNSNFQWSTTSPNQKDGKDITREPEMVQAFRDTWRYGIHSYLSYLRDRLIVARDLLADTGSIFVQIGDENVHLVRSLLDEVFGKENFETMITYASTSGLGGEELSKATNYILWACKDKTKRKYRALFRNKEYAGEGSGGYQKIQTVDGQRFSIKDFENLFKVTFDYDRRCDITSHCRVYTLDNVTSANHGQGVSAEGLATFSFKGKTYSPGKRTFTTHKEGMERLLHSDRLDAPDATLRYVRFFDDFIGYPLNNIWQDTTTGGFASGSKIYVVQTAIKIIQRCVLMTTDPGDLVLDPTCGSGTTAFVSEQWGRRWITIDTSRVALTLARARLMGARFPYYILADSRDGQLKEAEITQRLPSEAPTYNNIRHGFVYERIPHISLKGIANNAEIDVIWEDYAAKMDPLRKQLGDLEEWEIPRIGSDEAQKLKLNKKLLEEWWKLRLERQTKIDASISAHAESEYLYDKPYIDNSKIRVTGPFTVESLDPHRMLNVDKNGELIDPLVQMATIDAKAAREAVYDSQPVADYAEMILENLRIAGVQQMHKADKIDFETLQAIPGTYICAEGRYMRGEKQVRSGIFIGPEFGTVTRTNLVAASKEASDRGFDEIIALAFNYDAQCAELKHLGAMPILKARMNVDLHMAENLKTTNSGNLFVIFGEPDIDILHEGNKLRIKINGVDIFKPTEGKVMSSETKDIACWFIDTNYNEESFFIRQAYFLGQNDPYESLKKSLKAEIDKEAWETLHSDLSRPFDPPTTGRIAVKVINHFGDEVLKVYGEKDWKTKQQ